MVETACVLGLFLRASMHSPWRSLQWHAYCANLIEREYWGLKRASEFHFSWFKHS